MTNNVSSGSGIDWARFKDFDPAFKDFPLNEGLMDDISDEVMKRYDTPEQQQLDAEWEERYAEREERWFFRNGGAVADLATADEELVPQPKTNSGASPASQKPEPDRSQIETFVQALFKHATPGNWVSLRIFHDDREAPPVRIKSVKFNGNRNTLINQAFGDAELAASGTSRLVFCPPIATFTNNKRAKEIDLAEGLVLSTECDKTAPAARAKLEAVLGPATLVVASGGQWTNPETGKVEPKLHIHHRLKAPTRNTTEHRMLKEARQLTAMLVGADRSNVPVVHPIRWPGSLHRKQEARLCHIVAHNPDAEIDLDSALEILRKAVPAPKPTFQGANGKGGVDPPKIEMDAEFEDFPFAPVEDDIKDIPPQPFLPIKEGCGFLREAFETGGKDHDQSQWHLMVLAMTFVENGHELAHQLSNQHPDYGEGEKTEAMWDRKVRERQELNLGWPGCKAIDAAGSEHCRSCPHFDKGKSPIHLALRYDSPEPPRLPAELRNMLHLTGDQPVGDYKTRKHLLWAFILTSRRKGIDENEIVDACLDEKYRGCAIHDHVRDSGGKDYIKGQIERAINSDPLIDEQQRSIIRLEDGRLDEQWREVQRELIDRGCPVYVRGNRLVQPLWRWEKADGREVLTARFEPYNVHRLADMVARQACKFQKFNARKKGWKDIDPPDRLIERIIEAKNWKFSTIVGIINAPTMRTDGSLLTTEGYDPATQLWLKSSGDVRLPPIADRPGKADAQEALALLRELVVEFPFANDVARAAALAGIMTPVLRGALSGAVPLFAIIATEPRSGKTYLVELIAVIATGHIPVPTSIGSENTEEMEKRIETAGLSGRPIMHLNNLPNGMVVESVALAQLSTEGAISIRKLGKHEEGLCDCRATTAYLNGNNIVIAEDLVPRTASCQFNVRSERPESRIFEGDPISRVRADRGRYLGAVFTIVRAFMAAGCPRQPHRVVAGFEQWSRLVQQSLIWLGEQDPFGGMDELRALDPKHEELQALIDTLKKHFPADTPFTVADCKQMAEVTLAGGYGQRWEFVNPDLQAVMVDAYGKINAKALAGSSCATATASMAAGTSR
jgi:putative DNA primase/helicase